jgi:hypothetical protein
MITKEQFKRNLERRKRKAAIEKLYDLYTTQFIESFKPNGLKEAAPSVEVLDKWKQQLQ